MNSIFSFLVVVIVAILSTTSFLNAQRPQPVNSGFLKISLNTKDLPSSNDGWHTHNSNLSYRFNSSVPGDMYNDMMQAGTIGDPYYRFNDFNYRNFGYDNWTQTLYFDFPNQLFSSIPVELCFDIIRVKAEIFINDNNIGECHDEFYKHCFLIPNKFLVQSENELKVRFTSPVVWATQQYNDYPLKKPIAPPILGGLPHRNFARASQVNSGWDFFPGFSSNSIRGDVYLKMYIQDTPPSSSFSSESKNNKNNKKILKNLHHSSSSSSVIGGDQETTTTSSILPYNIEYITPHLYSLPFKQPVTKPLKDGDNKFFVDLYVFASCGGSSECFRDGSMISSNFVDETKTPNQPFSHNTSKTWTLESDSPSCGEHSVCRAYAQIQMYVSNVNLWFPRGVQDDPEKYGFRYPLHVQIFDRKQNLISQDNSKKVGFRSVELITWGNPLDYAWPVPKTPSNVMYFRINGIPVFARGANLVPPDAFESPNRVNMTVYDRIFESAVAANMNIIRVWGGGYPLKDEYYDLADRKGLLVWQEFEYACSEYPINPQFLHDARQEVKHIIRRLSSFSSIILWSGNNENGIYDKGPNSPYTILNLDTVMDQVIREDDSRPIRQSSPSDGFKSGITSSNLPSGSMQKPDKLVTGGNSSDTHYYNYDSCPSIKIFDTLKTPFASEFGFQSLTLFDDFKKISLPEDWSLFSPLNNHRQHHPQGNIQIAELIQKNFGVPSDFWKNTSLSTFKRAIYLSQLQQILCIGDEGEFYIRGRDISPFHTMGSLFWQLNIPWSAPTWSSISYSGTWKLLHYKMKKVYAKILVSAFYNESDGNVSAHVASQLLGAGYCKTGLKISLIPINTPPITQKDEYFIDRAGFLPIEPIRGNIVWTKPLKNILSQYPQRCPSAKDCLLEFHLDCDEDKFLKPFMPAAPSYLPLDGFNNITVPATPKVTVDLLSSSSSEISMLFSANNATAFYVYAVSPSFYSNYGHFSDNGFFLLPGQPRTITWSCLNYFGNDCNVATIDAKKFVAGIEIQHL